MGLLSKLFGVQKPSHAESAGKALFALALRSDLHDAVDATLKLGSLAHSLSAEEAIAYLNEMYMLRLFAVDWGAFQALGDTSVTASVLTQFWGVHRHLLSTDPSYVDKTHALDDRMKAYTLTVRAQTPNVFASVGKAFAIACGHANDPLYFLPGTIAFRDTVILVSKVLYDAGLSTTVLSPS